MKYLTAILLAAGTCLLALPTAADFHEVLPGFAGVDMMAAEIRFESCTRCHSYSPDGGNGPSAPNLWDVVGRPAGTAPGFDYSPALKDSGIVWTAESLNQWLSRPSAMVPGTTAGYAMANEQDRVSVIVFLLASSAKD